MIFHLNHSSGRPIYLQLMDQIKHAIETGALRPGDQLPTIRTLGEELVINPNTVIRAYRDLQHEGVIELRHGSGAFISDAVVGRSKVIRKGQAVMQAAIDRLVSLGLTEEEMRRLVENALALERTGKPSGDTK
jgi:GntR family transcriptional regulator